MIAAIHGSILSIGSDSLVIMAGQVGYKVLVNASILASAKIEKEIQLYTYTHVREDALLLFGFTSLEEESFFELLLSVSGIGPKTALSIINQGTAAIASAIQKSDVAFFTSIPRLGTKNAQKIIIELGPKMNSLDHLQFTDSDSLELMEALMSVGFSKREAELVTKNMPPALETMEEKIRFALKKLDHPKPKKI